MAKSILLQLLILGKSLVWGAKMLKCIFLTLQRASYFAKKFGDHEVGSTVHSPNLKVMVEITAHAIRFWKLLSENYQR
jgi:hypothetical protein